MIRYISHNDIDYDKWDRAIASSGYESAYGYSWYLDLAAENWDALVHDDYRAVMPLIWKKKYLVAHIYQPLNTQQLGIYTPAPPIKDMVLAFLEKIPRRFLLVDICFNSTNYQLNGLVPIERRANYELDLNKDYQDLCQAYHTNTRRNLAKATQAGLRTGQAEINDFLELKASRDPAPFRHSKYERLQNILNGALDRDRGTISAAWAGNKLVAGVFWLHSGTRTIYLLPASGKAGRECRAMFLLVDQLIREYAGTKKILDFEGSNIPSVARFIEGFGAAGKDYFRMTLSGPRLRNILNHLK